MCPRLFWARINAKRNSAGISSDSSIGVSAASGPSVGVSDSAVAGGGAGVSLKNLGNAIFGTGIVISGFLLRKISVVVAIYKGKAANINMPNTKPGKPRNWACIRWRHCADENMEKSNIKYNIAHVVAIYPSVQIMAYLCNLIKFHNLVM